MTSPRRSAEAAGEIVSVARVQPHAVGIAPRDDAEAVVLDLMQPIRPRRRPFGGQWQAGFDMAAGMGTQRQRQGPRDAKNLLKGDGRYGSIIPSPWAGYAHATTCALLIGMDEESSQCGPGLPGEGKAKVLVRGHLTGPDVEAIRPVNS